MPKFEVTVTSEFTKSERTVDAQWTLAEFKHKLEPVTGVPPAAQALLVWDNHDRSVTVPAGADADATSLAQALGLAADGWRVQVNDARPADQQLDLSGEVAKYEMPLDQYERRADSVLAWKREHQLGRFAKSSDAASGGLANEGAGK